MRILIVQTSFLGDIILSTPVIAGVRKLYPGAEIWVLTTPGGRDLLERDPEISGIIVFDKRGADAGIGGLYRKARQLKEYHFDRAYALQRSYRTALLLYLAGIQERIGFKESALAFLYHHSIKRNPNLHASERDLLILSPEISSEELDSTLRLFPPPREDLRSELRAAMGAHPRYVVLVPGSIWKTKQWFPEGYKKVASELLLKGLHSIIVGSKEDRDLGALVAKGSDATDLTGKTSLSELMVVIGGAALVICNDSMALHMASALKVPTVAVFCATSPSFGFGPWKNRAIVVEKKDLPCKPCSRHGTKACPLGTELCMRDLSPGEVLKAAYSLLG
jgi:heptosyltransferase II